MRIEAKNRTRNQNSEEYNHSSDISSFAQNIYKSMTILAELCKQSSFKQVTESYLLR